MESVFSNIYIVKNIFQHLSFQELLKIAKLCSEFRFAVKEYFYWKYRKIEAFETRYHHIVSNTVKQENTTNTIWRTENRILISRREFYEFLALNSNSIEILFLNLNREYEYRSNIIYYKNRDYFRTYRFENLKEVYIVGIHLTIKDLLNIIQKCPKLTKVSVDCIYRTRIEIPASLEDLPLITLDRRRIVKCISYTSVRGIFQHFTMTEDKYLFLEHIAGSCFNLQENFLVFLIERNLEDGNLTQANYCKDFTYGHLNRLANISKFNETLRGDDFKNLQKLTIMSAAFRYRLKNFFVDLNQHCQHLEYLHLQNCTIDEYLPIDTLKELILIKCRTITGKDLKKILQQKNLKSFTSVYVTYKDHCKGIKTTEQLSELNLRYNYPDLDVILWNLNTVTTLHWLSTCARKERWLNAINFPHLETLEVRTSALIFGNIKDFKHLRKLILNTSKALHYVDFFKVFEHPSLIYLAINEDPAENSTNYKNYLTECNNLLKPDRTSLKFIEICLRSPTDYYFHRFWKFVLSSISELQLRIRYNCEQLEGVSHYRHIINAFRYYSINICGYRLDPNRPRDESYLNDVQVISDDNKLNINTQYILLKKRNG